MAPAVKVGRAPTARRAEMAATPGGLGAGIWSGGVGTASVLNSTVATNKAGDGGDGGLGGLGSGVGGAGGQGGSGGTGGSGGGIYEAQPGSIAVASATVADNAARAVAPGPAAAGGDGNGRPGDRRDAR